MTKRPRVARETALVEVMLGGVTLARTAEAMRVLEPGHPPAYYLPRDAFIDGSLRSTQARSWCLWKGVASYFDVVGGTAVARRAAWTYPKGRLVGLRGHVAVDPDRVGRLSVNGEDVAVALGQLR